MSAATAWADAADSEARHLLGFNRPREAEELAKQAHALMAEVGARRPTDVRVKRNRAALAHVLTLALAEQFRDDEAMHWATESRQAALEYRRFHPSEMFASDLPVLCEWNIGALQYRAGRITEARDTFREAVNRPAEQPPARYAPRLEYLWLRIARIEAQLENFAAAREAVAQAKRSLHEYAREVQMSDRERDSQMEEDFWVEREVDLAEGKNSLVLAAAEEAVPRLEQLKQSAVVPAVAAAILSLQRETLSQACLAALRLRDPNAADRAARSLLALPLTAQNVPIRQSMDQPEDPVWRLVLQAEAVTLQGRQSEALPPITTAVDAYRDMEKKGATHLSFRQRFARALYVQALAQPTDATGTAQRRTSLAEAAKALGELTEEARQLRDTRALLAWIEAEQTKVGPAPQP